MRNPADNSQALAAFMTRKAEIDGLLGRLTALSVEHFGIQPDAVTWADVGTLGGYLERPREVRNQDFHEGEYVS